MKDLPVMNAIRELNLMLTDRSDVDRRTLIAIGIGRAISYILALPSMPVNNINQHYDVQHEPVVRSFLSRINELYAIDHDTVRVIARALYCFRYNLAYDPMTMADAIDRLATMQNGVIPDAYRGMINSVTGSDKMIEQLGLVMRVFQDQMEVAEPTQVVS
jgi:hypothetical protein